MSSSARARGPRSEQADSGQISQIINGAGTSAVTSHLTYGGSSAPASGVATMTDGTTTNHYTYDGAGRQVTRTVGTATTSLAWDVSSNLVETSGAGGHLLYVYDASGQRVAKIQVGDTTHTGAVTGYLGSTELTDANTAAAANHTSDTQLVDTAFVTGTRYYSFGGATVAVRQVTAPVAPAPATSTLSLMFGDEQGSATVMMQATLDATTGAMAPASTSPLVLTRNAYKPYGAVRGAGTPAENDKLPISKGWLNQVSDEASTGLVYLNARYYDSGSSRFVSPDPLMNPADPKTLDAFRYADNNPVTYTDASGLGPNCPSYLTGVALANCQAYAAGTVNYMTGEPTGTTNTPGSSPNPGGPGPESPPLSTELADLMNGGDVTCPPWVPCGSYTSWTGTVTWDPHGNPDVNAAAYEFLYGDGQPADYGRWWKDHGGTVLAVLGVIVGVACTAVMIAGTLGGGEPVCVGLTVGILALSIKDGIDNHGMTTTEAAVTGAVGVATLGLGTGASSALRVLNPGLSERFAFGVASYVMFTTPNDILAVGPYGKHDVPDAAPRIYGPPAPPGGCTWQGIGMCTSGAG